MGNGTLEKSARAACALALAVLSGPAWATLKVETVTGRGTTPTDALVARAFVDAHKRLESGARAHGYKGTFFFPQRVELFANGQKLPFKGQASRSGDLTLSFASSGPTAFDPSYQSLLQSVFASAKPVMDTVFGKAAVGGTIKVVNDDATISDRRAVLGGYYVPNAPGGPEIRLPVNLDQNTAAVNFVHAMLLAYQGPKAYPFDAYNEGLVRAATVVVMRTVSSNSAQVENVLNNLYEADDRYDWLNQPALSAEPFIAPNLLLANLPAGGSTGGIYLLRHQMAGSAWEKVLTEYPTFAAQFNQAYYASPSSYTSSALLESLAVSAVNSIVGTSSGRIEGLPVRSWIFRQWILSPQTTAGLKLLLEPSPLTPLNSGDFGVFDLALHAFTTDASGNETLLSGTSYPVFFRPDFTRFFTSAQDDVVSVSNGYGSVAPNFPSATFGTAPYKVVIDAPFGAKTQRVNLPAGAVYDSNGLRLQASGTVSGFGTNVANMTVRLTWAGGDSGDISVQNGAFGASISSTTFEKAQPVTVVLKQGTTTVLTRQINKGRGPLVTDLKAPATDATFNWTFANRLAFLGFPLDPFRPYAREVFGLDPTAVLVARYDPTLGRYVYFPDESEVRIGLGYFVRPFDTTGRVVSGRGPGSDPVVVSLKAGWNMVTNPTPNAVNVANIQVATTTQPFLSWATASGDLVGSAVFSLTPDSTHPDGGTLTPVTTVNPGQGVYVRCLSSQGADLLWGASSPAKTGQKLAAPLAAGEWRSKLSVTGDMFQSSSVELGQQKIGSATANERNDVLLPPGAGGFQAAVEAGATFYRKVFPMTQTLPVRVTLSNLIPGRWYTVNAVTEGKTGVSVALPSGITATLTTGRQTRFKATSTTATLGVRAL